MSKLERESQMLCKITGPNGESVHGGAFTYPLPKNGNPGEWAPDRHVDVCRSGYHLTSDVPRWWVPGARIWVAEGRGEAKTLEDKTCFASVRLTREITDAELATLHVFVSGAWEMECGKAVAYGSATVRAFGSATVDAFGSATVISRQAKPTVKLTEKAVHVARGDGTAKPKIHVARKEK